MLLKATRQSLNSRIRNFSTAINRRHLEDEGDWSYAGEWWHAEQSSCRTVFREISHCGNGVVSVLAHPSSQPGRLERELAEKWLQHKFRVTGCEWRTLHFNEYTRQSTVKVLVAHREEEPSSILLQQQPHCLAVPYVKSMISTGLATLSASSCDVFKNAVQGKQSINALCIGHGGGSIPLFLTMKIRGAIVHTVELDPTVIAASIKAMGFPAFSLISPSGDRVHPKPDPIDHLLWKGAHDRLLLFNSDAEKFILETSNVYDIILIDAYDGDDVFPHKLWRPDEPFMKALGNRLHPDHGTVVVNLHSDDDQQEGGVMGKHVSDVCRSYKDAVLGNEGRGIVYTVSVPWVCNSCLIVGRGFGGSGEMCGGLDLSLNSVMSHSIVVEQLLGLPFSCMEYIKRGFRQVK